MEWILTETREGSLRIWDREQTGFRYVIGADIAEHRIRDIGASRKSIISSGGVDNRDFSAAIAVEVQSGAHVASWHGRIEPHEFGSVLAALGKLYNDALLVVERNTFGASTVFTLANDLRYPNLYVNKLWSAGAMDQATDQFGWVTTKTSRPLLISRIHEWLAEDRGATRDTGLIAELRTMQFAPDGTPRAIGNNDKDDRVMALGMALQGRYESLTNKLYKEEAGRPRNEDERIWADLRQRRTAGERAKPGRMDGGGYGNLPRFTRDGSATRYGAPRLPHGPHRFGPLPPVQRDD